MKETVRFSIYFAKKDLKNRVAGSIVGIGWLILQPMLLSLIFIFLFSAVLKLKINSPYARTNSFPIFLLSGLLPWLTFQEGIFRGMTSVIENREIVKKIYLPLESLPIGYTASVYFAYGISILLFFTFCLIKGINGQYISLHTIPSLLINFALIYSLQFLMTLGIAFVLASISVFLRDIIQLMPLVMQVWFYITPIVYPESLLPSRLKFILVFNPFNYLLRGYKLILLRGETAGYRELAVAAVCSLAFLIIGRYLFEKLKPFFPDVL